MLDRLLRRLKPGAAAMALGALAAAFTLPAAATEFGETVETFVLDNGMQVVVIPDSRAPVVTHMVWYRVGAADEPPTKSGIAHFLEHLMFKGTERHPEGEFSRVIAGIGGEENAFTASDYTAYFQRVAKEHLGLLMEYEADRMTGLVLTPDAVASELQVVLEERASRVDNSPSAQLGEEFDAALYLAHPYGRPIIGWEHELAALTLQDALDFYRKHYSPDNAVLVVAGDVTAAEVRALAETTYGTVEPTGRVEERVRPREPEPRAARTVTLTSPRVDQESVRRGWVVPSATTAEPGQSEALDVLAQILGGGSTSRLYRDLVVDKRLAVSAGGWYRGTALDDSSFMIYASPAPDVTLETLAGEIDRVIQELIEGGVSDAELERARNQLIADAVYAQDSQATLARIYGAALTTGGTVEDVNEWPDRIRAVTAGDVVAAARRYLEPVRGVTGFLRGDSTPAPATAGDPSSDPS